MDRDRTELEIRLIDRIESDGPITFRDYMACVLYDPALGYYNTQPIKIGPAGDYYTASNVHEAFGAVLAQVFAKLLAEINCAERPLTIVEIGAGTGQLAVDVLSAFRDEHPELFQRLQYVVVEKSPVMRALQRQRLSGFADSVTSRGVEELGALCGVVFSNELVDAMPVHRVRLREGRLEEQYVETAADSNSEPRLSLVWAEPSTPRLRDYLARMGTPLAEGHIAEINLEAVDWLGDIAARMDRGFLVTIDYGDLVELLWDASRRDGTLRCFRSHHLVDSPLDRPGEQDLTSSVNFTALIGYGRDFGLERIGYYRQSAFLIDNGLLERIAQMEDLKGRLAAKSLLVPGGASDNFRVLIQKKRS